MTIEKAVKILRKSKMILEQGDYEEIIDGEFAAMGMAADILEAISGKEKSPHCRECRHRPDPECKYLAEIIRGVETE